MVQIKRIRFIRSWSPYNQGELAGFGVAVADRLIRDGYAVGAVGRPPVTKNSEPSIAPAAIPEKRKRGRPPKKARA